MKRLVLLITICSASIVWGQGSYTGSLTTYEKVFNAVSSASAISSGVNGSGTGLTNSPAQTTTNGNLSDNVTNPSTPVGPFYQPTLGFVWNASGSRWDRMQGDSTNGALVQGKVTPLFLSGNLQTGSD